jgi:hypothetical protein
MVPLFLDSTGQIAAGQVSVYWSLQSHSPVARSTGTVEDGPDEIEDHEEDTSDTDEITTIASGIAQSHDLNLLLQISRPPLATHPDGPGLVYEAFLEGLIEHWPRAFHPLVDYLPRGARREMLAQAQAVQAELERVRAAVHRVRTTERSEYLGPITIGSQEVDLYLNAEMLTVLDQIITAFLISEHLPTWRLGMEAGFGSDTAAELQSLHQALSGWAFSNPFDAVANMIDNVASETLKSAGKLGQTMAIIGGAVAVAAAAGTTLAAVGTAVAVTGALVFAATTLAPAAIAAVIKTSANLVRGEGSLEGRAWDSVRDSVKHVTKQYLSLGLGKVVGHLGKWSNRGSSVGATVVSLLSDFSGWSDNVGELVNNWVYDCAGNPRSCLPERFQGKEDDDQIPSAIDYGAGNCDQAVVAGGDTPVQRQFDMGAACGTIQLSYEMYTVKDRIVVYHDGQPIYDSRCVGGGSSRSLDYCGSSSRIVVAIEPNCEGGTSGTAWNFTLSCPF